MRANVIGGRQQGEYLIDILDEFGLSGGATTCLDFSDPACYPGTGQTIYDTGVNKASLTWTIGSTTSVETREPVFFDGVANNHSAGRLGSRFLFGDNANNLASSSVTRLTANSVSPFNSAGTSGTKMTFIAVFRNLRRSNYPYDGQTRYLFSASKTSGTLDYLMTAPVINGANERHRYRLGSEGSYFGVNVDVIPTTDRAVVWHHDLAGGALHHCSSEVPNGVSSTWVSSGIGSTASAVYVGMAGWQLTGVNAMIGRVYCLALVQGPSLQLSDCVSILARLRQRFTEV